MKLGVFAIGKIKDPSLRHVADDYFARIQRYVRCEEVELRDDSAWERALVSDATAIALEVNGKAWTSEQFAEQLERWARVNKGQIHFLIGGAEGIPRAVSQRTHAALSLSSFTLPHRLARVLLYEQLYRAMTILRGEPYAREG
ncbi:MAG TPA: 23S rRNA (pseudouridine(1915)-N(3))-methyltransferase RlmH [Polyangiaceae bacterium]|nr:23S rRNA (pseudouridine(1915)-N(3))-methyltransferase RlmH [Polyangiaceae bacterium]